MSTNSDASNDIISIEGITLNLKDPSFQNNIHVYKVLESTNITLKQMALNGAVSGTTVIANEQTKGKGRMGRSFFSPADSGIYMSILLRPNLSANLSILFTTAASVAICRAIQALTQQKPQIKWVNDIYLNGKKICGILTEAITNTERDVIDCLILGIGVNFSTTATQFPEELKKVAGSVFDENPSLIDRNKLIAEIIYQVIEICSDINSKKFIAEYKERSFILNSEIKIIKPNEIYTAKAIDIDDFGFLIIQKADGTFETINSGEISVRKIENNTI